MTQDHTTPTIKEEFIEDFDFFTIEGSIEEAGEMLAFARNEIGVDDAQHVRVPGQARDLVTFGFKSGEEYGLMAELSQQYERALYDGILVTRYPYKIMDPEEVIEFLETGKIESKDSSTDALIEGDEHGEEDLDSEGTT
jgi:hypothetical protein